MTKPNAIVASSSGLLFELQPMTFPWQAESGRYPHPFLSAIALSSLAAYLAFKAAKYGIEKGRSNGEAQRRQTNFEAQPRSPFRPLQRSVSLPLRRTERGNYEKIVKS